MKVLSLDLPLNREILTTVRLTTGGVCSLAGLDMEESEDCKVCVTEGLLLLLHSGFSDAKISFTQDDGVSVKIVGENYTFPTESYSEDEISSALLMALAQNVNMQKEGDCIRAIEFRFANNGR